MATTFQVIYLGINPLIDTDTDDEIAENAGALLGTYGSESSPLYSEIQTLSAERLSEDANDTYDVDNGGGYDTFRIDGGAEQQFDALAEYNITLTYLDGTTANVRAFVFQDTAGRTYLAPETSFNSDQAQLESKPIESMELTSVHSNTGDSGGDMEADRYDASFNNPVEGGTTTSDFMGFGFTDSDGDRITSGDDWIVGYGGNDWIQADGGNDYIYGGTGNDTAEGQLGNDSIEGNSGDDELYGGTGQDSLYGGLGNDTLDGGIGSDSLWGEAGNDSMFGDTGDDSLYGGTGADNLDGGAGNDLIDGGSGDDVLEGGSGDDTFAWNPGDGSDTISDFNFGISGALGDGNTTNNDYIDLSGYYDNLSELRADFDDDGVLNQSNATAATGAVDYSDNTQMTGSDGLTFTGADRNSFTADNTGVACFATGTRIRTPRGDVPIETLQPGDLVVTKDHGVQPVRWIGISHLDETRLERSDKLRPIWISKDVFGSDRDIVVSRQHAMWDPERKELVRAVHMLKEKRKGVRVARGKKRVAYVHLMFDRHELIYAEGVLSESMYPGPIVLNALAPEVRDELFAVFPRLRPARSPERVRECYGKPVRPLYSPRNQDREAA